MTTRRFTAVRNGFVLLIACVLFLAAAGVASRDGCAGEHRGFIQRGPPVAKLRKVDRERLIAARLQGQKEVMLLLAAVPRSNPSLVQQLTSVGATIRFREDTVDYIRARVPIDSVKDIAQLGSVQVMAVDGLQMYSTSQETPVTQRETPRPPDSNTPVENAFLPTRDIGAPQFVRDHPRFDGRGVTIANVDGNSPDMLSPELQKALSTEGTAIPKFADVINSLDPIDDESAFRVEMSQEVEARGGRFEWKGAKYLAPSDAKYRIGVFNVDRFGGGLLRAYLPASNQGSLIILWQEKTNLIWVDTNFNDNFADETVLTDFNSSYRPGILGTDNPATPLRETVAFTVLTYPQHKLVYFAPLVNGHATMTASVAAGHSFFGGQMNGVAPAARIISVLRKSVTHSFIEAMILSVKNPKVDLVSLQWAALMPPQDGNSVVGIIFQRLIDKYKKPIFSGADNLGPGISTNGEPGAPDKVISVGGYVNRLTWQSNYGVNTADDIVINLSARGPRLDGGFKPDLIAPAAVVAADFAYDGVRPSQLFVLPPGYSTGAGTSAACPMASGAAALLISAAKQSGVPYDAERIAWALKSSARYLPGASAHEQGNGLIDVAAAWDALKRAPVPVQISSSTEINVAVGPYLKTPYRGPGIYEREGWKTGQSGKRTITFTRTSGSREPVDYAVRWTGNDGTFTSASRIRLPLNTAVSFPVTIATKTAGVHSAILNLDEPGGAHSIYQVMNTVIAAEQFTASENYTITREGTAEFPSYASYFFNVPRNTSAFKVDMTIHSGTIRLRFMRPSGKEFDHANDTPVRWLPRYQTGGKLDRVIVTPEPGVWQVIVENQDLTISGDLSAEKRKAKFLFTASVFGAGPQTSFTESNVPIRDVANKQQITFDNYLAPFKGHYIQSPLSSAFSDRVTFGDGDEPLVYEINVPQGATTLTASVSATQEKADVDLYLYFCIQVNCELKAFGARAGVNEKIRISQPNGGKWKVVIDPVSIPAGGLTVDYIDIFSHEAFGVLTPSTDSTVLSKGGIAGTEATARIDAVPAGSRRLIGLVKILDRDAAIVGYDYNVTSKKVEAVRERVTLAEAILELRMGTKSKALSGAAKR